MRALVAALVLLVPRLAAAQTIEACEAPWLDGDRLAAILEVELADHRGPVLDATVVRIEACETELPVVSLSVPGSEPSSMTLRLGAVAERARTRFVALIVAELLRTRTPAPDEAAEAPILELMPAPPDAVPLPAPEALVVEVELAVAPTPAPTPLARSAAATLRSPWPSANPDEPPPPAPPESPWRIAVRAGARLFIEDTAFGAVAALGEVSLRFDRLLLAIGGGGTELGSALGRVRFGQATAGIGARLLEHRRDLRVGWDLRGDAGVAVASGEPANELTVGSTSLTYLLAASTQIEIAGSIGPFELGAILELGYQRGIVEAGPFVHGGLGGPFVDVGGTIAWTP